MRLLVNKEVLRPSSGHTRLLQDCKPFLDWMAPHNRGSGGYDIYHSFVEGGGYLLTILDSNFPIAACSAFIGDGRFIITKFGAVYNRQKVTNELIDFIKEKALDHKLDHILFDGRWPTYLRTALGENQFLRDSKTNNFYFQNIGDL